MLGGWPSGDTQNRLKISRAQGRPVPRRDSMRPSGSDTSFLRVISDSKVMHLWNHSVQQSALHDSSLVTEQFLTAAENLSFWTVINTNLGISAIQEPYTI